jgi:hypothetical protein
MRINLREYATELRHWVEAFEQFVDPGSKRPLSRLLEELENGRDNVRPAFGWKLAAPIRSVVADRYDGHGRTPNKVIVSWQFESEFETGPDFKKKSIWIVKKMVTQIRIHSVPDDNVILQFHYDMKNRSQLGPHVHMQLSEHYQKEQDRIPIAVPRFPAMTMLPTDCFDLVLSEFRGLAFRVKSSFTPLDS